MQIHSGLAWAVQTRNLGQEPMSTGANTSVYWDHDAQTRNE